HKRVPLVLSSTSGSSSSTDTDDGSESGSDNEMWSAFRAYVLFAVEDLSEQDQLDPKKKWKEIRE
ncbi:5051_t:CDS:2, partial [Racocetra persica]